MLDCLKAVEGYWCSEEERAKLQQTMWPDGVHLNKDIVASQWRKSQYGRDSYPGGHQFLMVAGKMWAMTTPSAKRSSRWC